MPVDAFAFPITNVAARWTSEPKFSSVLVKFNYTSYPKINFPVPDWAEWSHSTSVNICPFPFSCGYVSPDIGHILFYLLFFFLIVSLSCYSFIGLVFSNFTKSVIVTVHSLFVTISWGSVGQRYCEYRATKSETNLKFASLRTICWWVTVD